MKKRIEHAARAYQRFLRLSLLAMVGAAIALILTLILASVRLERSATEIAGNAAPAVIELSDANRSLDDIERLLENRVEGIGDQVLLAAQLHSARTDLDANITRYLDLPRFPGERQLAVDLRDDLTSVEQIAEHIEALPSNPPDRLQLLEQLRQAIDDLSEHLDQAARFNAEFLDSAQQRINETRRLTLPFAIAINVVGFGVASGSVVIALRLVRRFAEFEAEARQQLERRANDLEVFSAQVAHDLLSPLMTTNLALALLRDKIPADDQKTRTQLSRAESSLGYVRALVDGLFEFARADVEPSVRATADLGRVVQDVASACLPIAERDGIEFVIEPFESHMVAAFPGIVGSMISNLVQNSFRAVAKREVRRVVLRVTDERLDGMNMVRVAVEDTGGGVDPDIEPLLFQPHARNVRGRASPGLGLGLATVKRLAVRHRGSVGFQSARGIGSTFWFTLPCAESSSPSSNPNGN